MKTRPSLFTFACIALLLSMLAVTASGCAGNSSKQKTVKIALSTALGHKEIGGQHLAAAQAALQEVNYQVNGVKVELLPLDSGDDKTAFSPDREAEVAKQAVNDPAVLAYIGPPTTGQTKKSITVLNEAGIVQLPMSVGWLGFTQPGYAPGEPGIYYPTGKRTFFRVYTDMGERASQGMDYVVKKFDAKNVYIIDDQSAVFVGVGKILEVHAQDIGLKVIAHDSIKTSADVSDADLQAAAEKIVASKPDFLFAGVTLLVGRNFDLMVLIRELDPNIRIFGMEGLLDLPPNDDRCQKLEGSIQVIGGILPQNINTDASRRFQKEFEAINGGPVTQPFALTVYESVKAVLYAMGKAQSLTREGLLASMDNIGAVPGSVFGDWTFTKSGDLSIVVGQMSELKNCKWEATQVLLDGKVIDVVK